MKNPLLLKVITLLLFMVSYFWGIYTLMTHGQSNLLVFLAFCCFSSLCSFLFSFSVYRKY